MKKVGIGIIIILIVWLIWFSNRVITTLKAINIGFDSLKNIKLDFDTSNLQGSGNGAKPIRIKGTVSLTFNNVLNDLTVATMRVDIYYRGIYMGYYSKPTKTKLIRGNNNIIPFELFLMLSLETSQILADYIVGKLDSKDFNYKSYMIVYGVPIPSEGTFV